MKVLSLNKVAFSKANEAFDTVLIRTGEGARGGVLIPRKSSSKIRDAIFTFWRPT